MRHPAKATLLAFASLLLGLSLSSVAKADPSFFGASFSGTQEVPPNASPGFGTGFVTLDGNLLTFNITFGGLLADTVDAHIHCCAGPGVNAIVAIGFPSTGFPLGVRSGSYMNTFDLTLASIYNPAFITASGGTVDGARTRLISNLFAGQTYLNIHTSGQQGGFPGGEIRGQVNPIPEPGTILLLGSGLIGLASRARRKRKS